MKNFFEGKIDKIAWGLVLIGILTVIVFLLKTPFNDWSFHPNPNLFAQYGSFIGGVVGTLFSLAAVFFLYETLRFQKKSFDIDNFERTFFNLLKTQQEITEVIKAYSFSINDDLAEIGYIAKGREFFQFAKHDLAMIWKNIINPEYLEVFDPKDISEIQYISNKIDNIKESNNIPSIDKDIEIENVIYEYKLKYTNFAYKFSKDTYVEANSKEIKERVGMLYELFFQKYHYATGHYFRHLYNIIKFVEQNELKITKAGATPNKYIAFIQAQMSSYELMLVYYNAFLFPKLRQYLINYDFLENLALEDLIDESHNDIIGIKLIKSRKLLGFE